MDLPALSGGLQDLRAILALRGQLGLPVEQALPVQPVMQVLMVQLGQQGHLAPLGLLVALQGLQAPQAYLALPALLGIRGLPARLVLSAPQALRDPQGTRAQ